MKKCRKCSLTKENSDFSKCSARTDGLCSHCRECAKSFHDSWIDRNRQYFNLYKRGRKYGLTEQDVKDMYFEQEGCCFICLKELLISELNIDHDHETGAVRKLLCVNCNLGLGNFRDSPEILEAAIEYLKKF